ncbi:hypothetical protein H0A36_03870 [Endozoicomonas sp. SM1973]|uniref:ABC transmembrane type-1 domain-containing protein n=1 Tax=Spartinivicinus marinus TaxID=2994442 RepID=A0A853HV61_9GAMM|nr:hypothetical protein [Spartinivicinus marinus]MCX4029558.1 hypothetical protein [Spartinivicinus marinus]NYZ65133.1 hypothetical protein [Spartinivicinus marinus]
MTLPKNQSFIKKQGWPLDSFDTNRLIESFVYTLWLTGLALVSAVIAMLLFAFLVQNLPPRCSLFIRFVINLQRMTPPIVLLYLIYFGVFHALSSHITLKPGAALISVMVLSLYTGAGASTVLSDALIKTLDKSNTSFEHWVSALLLCQQSIKANLVNLVKAAGMASVLAVPNAILIVTSIASSQGNVLMLMNFLMIFYYLTVLLCIKLCDFITHYLSYKLLK